MGKYRKSNIQVIILLLLALAIRLVSLNQSLWHDESGTVWAVEHTGFISLITQYSIADFHPPGYFILLWGWVKIFGGSEIASRLPSVIFGVLTVWLIFLIGKKLFNEKIGILGSLLLAFAPLHIYYSQEARMYSFAACSVTLSFYFLIKLIKKEKYALIGYVASLVLIFYSDYVAYFAILPQIFFILLNHKEVVKKYFVSLLASIIFLVPWLLIFPKQLLEGLSTASTLTGWKDVVGGANIKNIELLLTKVLIGRISFDNKIVYGLILAIFIGIFYGLIIKAVTKHNLKNNLLIYWLCLPALLAFIVALFVPVFSYFRFLFLLPPLYLLVAEGVESTPRNARNLLIVILISLELFASFTYLLNPQFQREDWRDATAFVDSVSSPQTLILFKDVKVLSGYEYYTKLNGRTSAGFKDIPAKSQKDIARFDLEGVNQVVVFDYLKDLTDPSNILENYLTTLGFRETLIENFRGVGFVKIYSKSPTYAFNHSVD